MAIINARDWNSSSWQACMRKSYCKWPVIAGIVIGGILLIPIIWGCARLICCRSPRRKGPKGGQFSKQSSKIQTSPPQGYQPAPPPLYDDPKPAQFDGSKPRTVKDDDLPPTPSWDQAGQRKGPDGGHDEDVELGRLEPVHAQNAPMLAHQAPPPMARLSSINTRNPHDSLHRPHQSLHASHSSQDPQNPFKDPPPAEFPPHRYSPPAPPRPYSPYSPQHPPTPYSPHPRPYSPYSPQQPPTLYSPQRPYSPYSPYATSTPKYESAMFTESQQTYKAYSPSISTQNEASSPHNEPVELASPYNKRPASIAFARDSQLQLAESKRSSGSWLSQPDGEPTPAASSPRPESNEKPDASHLPQSGTQQVPSSAPPAAERLSQAPGRAL